MRKKVADVAKKEDLSWFKDPGARPWDVADGRGDDGVTRPYVIDANGAMMAEIKVGYGMEFARKFAQFMLAVQDRWPKP